MRKYIKPQIQEKKVKVAFFLSNSKFLDSADLIGSGSIIAQASGPCSTMFTATSGCATQCGTTSACCETTAAGVKTDE